MPVFGGIFDREANLLSPLSQANHPVWAALAVMPGTYCDIFVSGERQWRVFKSTF